MRYRGLLIDDVNPPVSAREIAELEDVLGCRLPHDYQDFLVTCNGGYLDYSIPVQFEDGHSESLGFVSLYRLEPGGSWETNPFELASERDMAGFPQQGVLPIARDGGSSILYLDLREGYRVMAFVQGLPAWTGKRQQDALVEVAGSFAEYLDKLVITDEMAELHITDFDVTDESAAYTMEWLDSRNPRWREKFRDLWNSRVPGRQI